MEFKEISIPDGIVQQIDHEGAFADIAVVVGNREYLHSNENLDASYEDMLEEIENKMGSVPVFMRSLPKKILLHNWSSWKMVDEINMERARYLLSTDEILEKTLGKTPA